MPAISVQIARATPDDAPALTAIAFAAKRHWRYPETWIQQWRASLTITPELIAASPTFVAHDAGELAGFTTLRADGPSAWLDHLWIAPEHMGRGIGRALFAFAEHEAQGAGFGRLMIESDPHAAGFYLRQGATACGHAITSVDGRRRLLPLFTKPLRRA